MRGNGYIDCQYSLNKELDGLYNHYLERDIGYYLLSFPRIYPLRTT